MLPRNLLPCLAAVLCAAGCGGDSAEHRDDVAVSVRTVALDERNAPLVILEEDGGERYLPIWIGSFEARSIASQMEQHTPLRPNTHDLAKSLIAGLEGTVERVTVTELRDGTYYARLWLRCDGRLVELDSRPSDAIAIALRTGAPIFVRAPVFDAADEVIESTGDGHRIRAPQPTQPGRTEEATRGVRL